MIGPITLKWLQRFCDSARLPELAPSTAKAVEGLLNFAAVTEADWRKTLLSKEFIDWVETDACAEPQTRLFGTRPQIQALVRQYPSGSCVAAAPEDIVDVPDGTFTYYQLTVDDLKLTQVERKSHGTFQAARIIPAVDATRLEEVLVLPAVPQPQPLPLLHPALWTTL